MGSWRSLFGLGAATARQGGADATLDSQVEAGIAAFERGDLAAAQAAFTTVLASMPTHARALALSGVVRLASGDAVTAEDLLRRSLAIDATPALHWFNLGNALAALNRTAEAAAAFDAACTRAPDHFGALFNLARARLELGEFDAAIAAGKRFVQLRPQDPSSLAELGTMHFRRGEATLLVAEFDAAIDLFRAALNHPDAPTATVHNARLFLGNALTKRARHTEALALYSALLAVSPDELDANLNVANCFNTLGRMRDAAPLYDKVVRLYPQHLPAISSAISAADYDQRPGPGENITHRRDLMRRFVHAQRRTTWPNDKDPDRRLRIGYVSPDFREHVAMTLFEGVLVNHDRARFEIFAYDATAFRDARNRTLRAHADHWREIDKLDIESTTALVREDAIDILIDLAGHTAGNRLMLFARKPAPVAATWLAYPGSTGLPEIDYIVSDPHTSPPQYDAYYSEKVWRLPATRFCFMPPANSPAPRLPRADAPPTFGCFNNISKLNPDVFALWKRILDAVPDARLLLKYSVLDDATGRAWLTDDLRAAGIDPARVTRRGWTPYAQALDDYADVHVALDPFPFCGGLTTLDALWMGVPVVTLQGQLMAARQSAAFLANIGAPELIAADADDYVRIAIELMRDRDRIAGYRTSLREALRASPLFDYAGFTTELEKAWRGMWRNWCVANP